MHIVRNEVATMYSIVVMFPFYYLYKYELFIIFLVIHTAKYFHNMFDIYSPSIIMNSSLREIVPL